MTSKLACALAFTALLALTTAQAQTGERTQIPGGPLMETAPQRARTPSNAQLSARVLELEAQVAQLAGRVQTLSEQMALVESYPTHRHNFNDDISGEVSAHDITGLPHQ